IQQTHEIHETQQTHKIQQTQKENEITKNEIKIVERTKNNANKNEIKYVTLIDLPDNTSPQKEIKVEEKKELKKNLYFTETLKKNALYTLLAAGGLFGAYTLFKNTSE
ncbi:MAG: hypothetical protein JSR17_00935, partial [Proteobacteria bacterium]|nr:hypothetical protein [Pseudomonadota bacterium]